MRVVELSTPISQFQHDSTHSLWEKQHSSPKGDLWKMFQRVFHQHWPPLGQKQFCPSALYLWGLYQNGCSQERDVLQALHGNSCLHSSVTKRLLNENKSHRMGRQRITEGPPSVQPLSKSRASTTPQPLLQCLPTLVVEVCLICNPFHFLKPVSLAGLPLVIWTVCFPLLHSPH